MKTVKDVKKEIEAIAAEIQRLNRFNDRHSITERKKLRARLPELRFLAMYLTTKPSPLFIEKEQQRLENRIAKIMELYRPLDPERFTKKDETKSRQEFNRKWSLSQIKTQLAALNYLLSETVNT